MSKERGARPRLSDFSRRLLAEWRRRGWPRGGARVVVAVSGGADSVALLLAFDELLRAGRFSLEASVAHLNHGLRGGGGEEDARWVGERAASLGLDFVAGRADVCARAREGRDNLEQAARRARYEFLNDVARAARAWAVLTAHTLDDQAETILLRLLRGSGAEGLTGIRPERALAEGGTVKLVRPLVAWARRADTEGFCRERGVEFRTDEMNEDESFARVRVRRRLLPLLETFNPRVTEALARTAELLRADADVLDEQAERLLEEARGREWSAGVSASPSCDDVSSARERESSAGEKELRARVGESDESLAAGDGEAWPLRVDVLSSAPVAVRRRALRRWVGRGRGGLRRVGMVHVLAVEKLLEGARGGRIAELPGRCAVERRRGRLLFIKAGDKAEDVTAFEEGSGKSS